MKRPPFPPDDEDASGRVARDDRGNAVWQWKDEQTLNERLRHPGLEIDDDEPTPVGNAKVNKVAGRIGYDPYRSGGLIERSRHGRRDLRALSQWIALKKKRGEDTKP